MFQLSVYQIREKKSVSIRTKEHRHINNKAVFLLFFPSGHNIVLKRILCLFFFFFFVIPPSFPLFFSLSSIWSLWEAIKSSDGIIFAQLSLSLNRSNGHRASAQNLSLYLSKIHSCFPSFFMFYYFRN